MQYGWHVTDTFKWIPFVGKPQSDTTRSSCSSMTVTTDCHNKVCSTYGSNQPYPLSSYHRFLSLEIDILTGTEMWRKRETVEEVADLTVVHRDNIKQDDQGCKQEQG